MKSFQSLVVHELPDGSFSRRIEERTTDDLPPGGVLIRVHYSSLNYKDALSATGNKGVTRKYPHTPGVDAAGLVEESSSTKFRPGDPVIVTGYDLGSNTWGGFGGYVRVPEDWVVPLPGNLLLRESMMHGTAGFTAALGIHKLRTNNVMPESGDILVTGSTGGVGCLAVAILSKLGYRVIALTGKPDQRKFLLELGAHEVIGREMDTWGRALLSGRWAGAIETVGGGILDTVIRSTKQDGSIACCGNVLSGELSTSVYPFILRGVNLLGINSAFTPMQIRHIIWEKLAGDWKIESLPLVTTEISLREMDRYIDLILKGKIRGRILLHHGGAVM